MYNVTYYSMKLEYISMTSQHICYFLYILRPCAVIEHFVEELTYSYHSKKKKK